VLARLFIQVIAALRAEASAPGAAYRLKREVEQQVFPGKRAQVKDPCLRNCQEGIGSAIGWIDKEIIQPDLQRLIECFQTAHTFQIRLGPQVSLAVQSLGGAGEAYRTAQVSNFKVVADLDTQAIKVEIAVEADVPMEQKPDVQPQW
jgi:hypothetical protein